MEFTSLVDTSLDLSFRPLPVLDKVAKQEVQSNFTGLSRDTMLVKDEAGDLLEELNRVSSENKKLTEMLTVVCENYNALRNQLMEYMNNQQNNGVVDDSAGSRKRKAENISNPNNNNKNNNLDIVCGRSSESSSSDEESSCKKPREEHIKTKVSVVSMKTEASDTSLIVKDGYQWRKYGQKVTRDNPSPRAYFRCSFAPGCPVKKKVQRSIDDQSIVVATYEGEHNHPINPSKPEAAAGTTTTTTTSSGSRLNVRTIVGTTASVPCSTTLNPSGPTITLDLTEPKTVAKGDIMKTSSSISPTGGNSHRTTERDHYSKPEFQQFLIEQMASSLTKDPSFKAALAAAISGKILQHNNQTSRW
ncbi:probable WRKY transcription factor 40 [Nicotiana tomentosiformis]|uniref:probable WRKY transcription factor 40 n=1 Tax=Nicotiana tomentosiformis TaxID=4098 RepID=UPI00051BCEB1|nr:probable WRKY transcription factor 40 [Nicotiana tomentosiformis]